MARATDLAELGVTCFPWWQEVSVTGRSIRVVIDDPDEPEGSGKTLTKTLSPAEIHSSFAAMKDRNLLCCGAVMVEEGYDGGCAGDADLVLQYAAVGDIVYG
jgi:hypothetical protein